MNEKAIPEPESAEGHSADAAVSYSPPAQKVDTAATSKRDQKKNCEHCGKEFRRSIYPKGLVEASTSFLKRKFCSLRCSAIHKNRNSQIQEKTCENCNKRFGPTPYNGGRKEFFCMFKKRRFCSRKCSAGFNSAKRFPK